MPRHRIADSSEFWKRVQLASRILLALIGGAVFAVVAWEPMTPKKTEGDAPPPNRIDGLFATEHHSPSTNDGGGENPEQLPAWNSTRKKPDPIAWGATPDEPASENVEGSQQVAQSDNDEGEPTVRPNSRAPPN
jgi:hypothetical protein